VPTLKFAVMTNVMETFKQLQLGAINKEKIVAVKSRQGTILIRENWLGNETPYLRPETPG